MTDERFWLLDAAVELRLPLQFLAAPNSDEILNRKGHGSSTAAMADALSYMVKAGKISLRCRPGVALDLTRLTTNQILQLIHSPVYQPCWYGLTATGGTEWEGRAKPDWSRYSSDSLGSRKGWIEAANEDLAEELLELTHYIWRDREIDPRSVRRTVRVAWRQPTGKRFPTVSASTFAIGKGAIASTGLFRNGLGTDGLLCASGGCGRPADALSDPKGGSRAKLLTAR